MSRRAAVVAVLAIVALVAAGCSSGGDDSTATTSSGGASTDTTLATDASLIPPSDATSPTSGPPNTDPLAGAGEPTGATCEDHGTPSPASAADDLDLGVQLGETLETGRVRWTLVVTNRGERAVTLVYPSGQDGDVALRQDGEVAYQWSANHSFLQEVRCQLIGAGQEYRVDLRGSDLDVAPGDYQLVASLSADPAPAPARLDVTVVDPDGN